MGNKDLKFSYIILDKGYDIEEVHSIIYEDFEIIPVIIRKKIAYPKGFTDDGFPLYPFRFPMKRKGIEYQNKRTKYACYKKCFLRNKRNFSYVIIGTTQVSLDIQPTHTLKTVIESLGERYQALISTNALKPYRTGIEKNYAIVKENCYRMEAHNTYTGIDNVQIHVTEYDIVLTQDIVHDFLTTGKTSSIIKT